MPTRDFACNREQSVAEYSGASRGNGGDQHGPIGKGSFDTNFVFRLLQRFATDWSGMTKVTKIEYRAKLTGGVHTNHGSTRRIQIKRLAESFSEAGGGENSWVFGGSGTQGFGTATEGSTSTFSLTAYSDGDWVTLDITDRFGNYIPPSVLQPDGTPGLGLTNYGLRLMSDDEASTGKSVEFYGKDSGYEPYVRVTYTTNTAPSKPVLVHPVSEVIAAGSSPVFSWTGTDPDASDTLAGYDLQVDNAADFATPLYSGVLLTAGTIAGFNVTNAPYVGPALPADGSTLYWRVRNKDSAGSYGAWSDAATFTMGAVPSVSGQAPNAALADIWNLDDTAAIWTVGGSHAKPIVSFVYGHPAAKSMQAYRLRIYNSASVVQYDSGTTLLSALNGATVTLNAPYAVILGTLYKWGVEVQDVDGNWSTAMGLLDFKVRWGQAIYAQNVGVGAQNLEVVAGALTGTGARLALISQSASDAAGTGGTAWSTDVGALAPTVGAYIRVLVRLAATVSGQNPTLSDLTLTYAAAASNPDKWLVAGTGTLTLDGSQRRFGYYSAKLTATTTGAMFAYPWRRITSDGVLVTPDTDYVFSVYVKTGGPLGGSGNVQLFIRTGSSGGPVLTPLPQPVGTAKLTVDSSPYPDGWQRIMVPFHVPTGVTQVWPNIWFQPNTAGQSVWVDGGKLEEGRVTSLWTPGFLGEAITLDALGVIIDASKGGLLRLRGTTGGVRDVVELGASGLKFGTDSELYSPLANALELDNGEFIANGPKATLSGGQFRAIGGNYGFFIRNDGSNTYIMLTDSGNQWGTWNALRPMYINDATGDVTFGQRVVVQGLGGGGTVFPTVKSTGDRFFRTDLGSEYYWDGTRWLSTQLFELPLPYIRGGDQPYSATPNAGSHKLHLPTGPGVWLIDAGSSFHVASGGTALSGSHKWEHNFLTEQTGASIGILSIASGASAVWRAGAVALNMVLPAGDVDITTTITKTGTPGSLWTNPYVRYRLIAT